MCGHGTIGTVTIGIEEGLIKPRSKGVVRVEVPAGLVIANYNEENGKIKSVKFTNVPSYLHAAELTAVCPQLGELIFDVAYGGNFYAD